MTGDYAAERGAPKVPPANISLHFTGAFLVMAGRQKKWKFSATSGSGADRGNRIPPGRYWVNPAELWSDSALRYTVRNVLGGLVGREGAGDAHLTAWGFHRLTIHPWPDTDTGGRGGFFIHGGDQPGSLGCIDLTHEMELFVRALRTELGSLEPCYLDLYVAYGAP